MLKNPEVTKFCLSHLLNVSNQITTTGDIPGGPVAENPCSQCSGAQVQSLVKELDPICCN